MHVARCTQVFPQMPLVLVFGSGRETAAPSGAQRTPRKRGEEIKEKQTNMFVENMIEKKNPLGHTIWPGCESLQLKPASGCFFYFWQTVVEFLGLHPSLHRGWCGFAQRLG